jgi:hypothetical protein
MIIKIIKTTVPAFLGPWGGGEGGGGYPGGYQAEECSIKWGAVDMKWQNENCVARATFASMTCECTPRSPGPVVKIRYQSRREPYGSTEKGLNL